MEQIISDIPQVIWDGLFVGSFYALIALGYSMVYGIIKLLNFAHGDIYMVGAFIGYQLLISVISGHGTLRSHHRHDDQHASYWHHRCCR